MFEGETTIKFSKEAAMLMLSKNVSDMFGMALEVTALDYDYQGLRVSFAAPEEKILREPEETELATEPEETPAQPAVL